MSERQSSNISNMTAQRLCHLWGNADELRFLSFLDNRVENCYLICYRKARVMDHEKRSEGIWNSQAPRV